MKKFLSVVLFLGLVPFASAKEMIDVQFRPDRLAEDRKFYQEVRPLIDHVVAAVKKKRGEEWAPLCDPKVGILFRYLGQYNTKLSCAEWGGLFTETKKRWWGRYDGSGLPITGTFKNIWEPRLKEIVKHYEIVGVNRWIKSGNTPDRGMDKLPFVDLTWSGRKTDGEMGWRSLRLFFVYKKGQWFLKGLDIYQWTI